MKRLIAVAALALGMVLGCSGLAQERKVEGNAFISLVEPVVRIQVSPSFRYIGKVGTSRHHQTVNGAKGLLVTYTSWLFLVIGEDSVIRQGVIIRVDRIGKGSWGSEVFSDLKNKLVWNYQTMAGRRYEHVLALCSDIFTDDETACVSHVGEAGLKPAMKGGRMTFTGFTMPKCFLTEAFGTRAGAGSDTRMCVFYFQSLSELEGGGTCSGWGRGGMAVQDRQRVLALFRGSRYKALSFLDKGR
jgi:hypothetical protein